MKRELTVITFIYLVFILLLSLSGSLSGFLSEAVYYIAFLLPIAIGLWVVKNSEEKNADIGFKLTRSSAFATVPIVFPVVFGIFLLSLGTSALMNRFGFSGGMEITEPLPLALLIHGLIPALLEEALFRYIPLKLLLPYSKKWAVLLSSLFFALIHMNIFTIPYALFAGIIFALTDICFGSVIPSFILHLANNFLSLVFTEIAGEENLLLFLAALALASFVSLAVIIMKRDCYKGFFSPLFAKEAKEKVVTYTIAPAGVIILTLFIAVSNLFIK